MHERIENVTTASAIEEFLAQKSVAGVSRQGRKFGNIATRELRARGYRLFPVHPMAQEIDGDVLDDAGHLSGIVTVDNLLEALAEQLDAVVRVIKTEQTRESATRK